MSNKIGYLAFVPPYDEERWALRFLLRNRTGCSSYTSLRTIDGLVLDNFEQARFEFKVAHAFDNEYYSSLRDRRIDEYWENIILEDDIAISNTNMSIDQYYAEINNNVYMSDLIYKEQLEIAVELGHY